MQKSISEFLTFNEKKIYFLSESGKLYIDVESIFDILELDRDTERKYILNDFTNLSLNLFSKEFKPETGRSFLRYCLPINFLGYWFFLKFKDSPQNGFKMDIGYKLVKFLKEKFPLDWDNYYVMNYVEILNEIDEILSTLQEKNESVSHARKLINKVKEIMIFKEKDQYTNGYFQGRKDSQTNPELK